MSFQNELCTVLNATSVGWVSDPSSRGTFSLVLSCLTTLMICTFSVIHINIPKPNESSRRVIWRHARWTVMGIFGPELVIWAAWRQLISARALFHDLQELRKEGSEHETKLGKSPNRRHSWTITHCFYAGMGGFVIEPEDYLDESDPSMPNPVRLTVTPRGVLLLAQCNLLPNLSEEDILDKSKTDGIGKLIAMLQGCWMLLQVLTRLIANLPVTILEVNALGHVFCAIVTYVLWWNKPRFVLEPTRLQGEWLKPLAAFMYMSSQVSDSKKRQKTFLRDFGTEAEIGHLAYDTRTEESQAVPGQNLHEPTIPTFSQGRFVVAGPCAECNGDESSDMENLAPSGHDERCRSRRWKLAAIAVQKYPAIQARMTRHSSQGQKRMQQALRLYPEMPGHIRQRSKTPRVKKCSMSHLMVCDSEELVTTHASDWPADDLLRGFPGIMMGATLWLASIGYGLVHLAAWHAHFTTNIEAWLWRASAIDIVGSGLLWISVNVLSNFSGTVWWYWYDLLEGKTRTGSFVLLGCLCTLGGSLYVSSRIFLVLEAFLGLRSLSPRAYLSPEWILTVPHL